MRNIEPDICDAGDRSGRAADNLFRMFAEMIAHGKLKDGDPLPPEREIVETYGVSRTVAREAVKALANRGLVEARPRFRPVVRTPNFDSAMDAVGSVVTRLLAGPGAVRNLFETRILVEVSVVRHAASYATKDELAAIKSALDANGLAAADSDKFYETDREYHKALASTFRNPIVDSVNRAFAEWLGPQWKRMPRLPERNSQNHASHALIFEAILMRDPDAAEKAMRKHLDDAWDQVRTTFE